MSTLPSVTDATFAQEVLASETPVLVEYWAEWCGPCRQVAPVLEELAVEYGDRMRMVKMNSDENVVTAATQRVMAVPTIQVFQRGQLVAQIVGAKPKRLLAAELAQFVE
ncbi:MAG: thioredoxin [Aeromicrobium sp.]|nr:thioredoxin [Aeromicrobium sp.]